MVLMTGISGQEIERLSMEIIGQELGETSFNDRELAVVKRIIHATADFDFVSNIRFHENAIENGIKAIQDGRTIVTDTKMAAAGISKNLLTVTGNEIKTPIALEECRLLAHETGGTMAEAAMEIAGRFRPGIVVIGNAPTALLKVIDMIKNGNFRPLLVIGVPVGFVNAQESKEELLKQDIVPFITCIGRKGGTPVAVAIVNALIRLSLH